MGWFLYDRDLHHERVYSFQPNISFLSSLWKRRNIEGLLVNTKFLSSTGYVFAFRMELKSTPHTPPAFFFRFWKQCHNAIWISKSRMFHFKCPWQKANCVDAWLKHRKFDWFQFKVAFSPSKKLFYLLQWKLFKNDGKCFLFHFKSSFRSQNI